MVRLVLSCGVGVALPNVLQIKQTHYLTYFHWAWHWHIPAGLPKVLTLWRNEGWDGWKCSLQCCYTWHLTNHWLTTHKHSTDSECVKKYHDLYCAVRFLIFLCGNITYLITSKCNIKVVPSTAHLTLKACKHKRYSSTRPQSCASLTES